MTIERYAKIQDTIAALFPGACIWRLYDWDANTWKGDCGILWQLGDGTPREHAMNYCPRCGRVLTVDEEEE